MILEIDLDNLVAQSEHNRMFGPHPLLDVDRWDTRHWWLDLLRHTIFILLVLIAFKIGTEVLQQRNFLLEILGIVSEVVSLHDVLLLRRRNSFPFVVIEGVAVRVNDNLGRVVEEDTSSLV